MDNQKLPETFDLSRFEHAFELLGQGGNWKFMVKDAQRQVMVWVALNLDFESNENQQVVLGMLASTGSGTLDTTNVLNCLRAIRETPTAKNEPPYPTYDERTLVLAYGRAGFAVKVYRGHYIDGTQILSDSVVIEAAAKALQEYITYLEKSLTPQEQGA